MAKDVVLLNHSCDDLRDAEKRLQDAQNSMKRIQELNEHYKDQLSVLRCSMFCTSKRLKEAYDTFVRPKAFHCAVNCGSDDEARPLMKFSGCGHFVCHSCLPYLSKTRGLNIECPQCRAPVKQFELVDSKLHWDYWIQNPEWLRNHVPEGFNLKNQIAHCTTAAEDLYYLVEPDYVEDDDDDDEEEESLQNAQRS